ADDKEEQRGWAQRTSPLLGEPEVDRDRSVSSHHHRTLIKKRRLTIPLVLRLPRHSERSRPTFSSPFAPAKGAACGYEESLFSSHPVAAAFRPPSSLQRSAF